MTRWIAPALGVATLIAAGLVVAPTGVEADKDDKRIERRVEVVGHAGGRLGVRLSEVQKDDVARLKLGDERGALVKAVEEGSAAEKAGIKEGDVILRYQGEAVLSAAQLARMVRETPGGRTVSVEVSRAGAPQKLSATLAEGRDRVRVFDNDFEIPIPPIPSIPPMPPMAEMAPPPGMPEMAEPPEMPEPPPAFRWDDGSGHHKFLFREMGRGPRKLGIEYQEIDGQLAQYFKLAGERGVLVTSVDAEGPAGKAGLKAGDVILKFDGKAVNAGDDLRDKVRRAEGGKEVAVTVQRDGRTVEVKVQLANPGSPRRAGGVSL
jgi:serine protease Do